MLQEIRTKNAPIPQSPLSQAVRAGDFLFVSGQVSRRPDGEFVTGDFPAEVRCALDNLKSIVETAGATLDHVCKLTAYLTDPSLFSVFNDIYRQYFTTEPLPARTAVISALARPGLRIEVDAVVFMR